MGAIFLAGYVGSIVLANWLIGHVGVCVAPGGPCLVPVGFGLEAPSGVLAIGAALFLRDGVQEQLGRRWSVLGILVGAALSALLSPALALASGSAFLLSELADFVVYQPLRDRGRLPEAVLLSGVVGGLVDSAVFLWLAFGSLAFLAGQFVGKTEMALLGAAVVWMVGQRRAACSRT